MDKMMDNYLLRYLYCLHLTNILIGVHFFNVGLLQTIIIINLKYKKNFESMGCKVLNIV